MSDTNEPRRLNRDPSYVNRVAAESRPDVTTDNNGNTVVPTDPPYLQENKPRPEVSDQGDSWQDAAGIEGANPVTEPSEAGTAGGSDDGLSDPGAGSENPDTSTGDKESANADDALIKDESEVEGLNKDELVAYAEVHGVDSSGTKAEIQDRLREAGKVRPSS